MNSKTVKLLRYAAEVFDKDIDEMKRLWKDLNVNDRTIMRLYVERRLRGIEDEKRG